LIGVVVGDVDLAWMGLLLGLTGIGGMYAVITKFLRGGFR
jgi:hypothetical protein